MGNKFTRAMQTVAAAVALAMSGAVAQEILVKDGDTIAFMGDSITQQGAGSPSGYVRLVATGLEANGIKTKTIPAGISGHKSDQMLGRLETDVLSKKPNWMTLSCGVNDVWHGLKGVPLDAYKQNITAIADRCQAAGVKVMFLTATMIGEDQPNQNNQKLIAYNDFLHNLAKERKCPLADLNADMQAAIKNMPSEQKGNLLTGDGVHMNVEGNQMMAVGVLKAFGLNAEQLQKAQSAWLDIPAACEVTGKTRITIRQFQQLKTVAADKKMPLPNFLDAELAKAIEPMMNPKK